MGSTVTIACKRPHGYRLVLVDKDENGKEIGRRFILLNGAHETASEGGYGLTDGVDQEFFETWLARNPELPVVKHGLIYVHDGQDLSGARDAPRHIPR
jgi:hypothetical protein